MVHASINSSNGGKILFSGDLCKVIYINHALMNIMRKIHCTKMVLCASRVFGAQKKSPARLLRQAIFWP
jgi:hypothetical protein